MKIVIVGDGKVGATLAEQLSGEDHDITVIDRRAEALRQTSELLDVMVVEGNGATLEVQLEAGVDSADLVIAVTSTDELNLLACLIAKKAGARHTIARVRSPEYSRDLGFIKEELGLSLAVNPELATATEIARLLRFPSAIQVDTFSKGRVELLQIRIPKALVGLKLKDMSRFRAKVLICAVERGDAVHIPDGRFQLKEGDRISFVASAADSAAFLQQIGFVSSPIRQVMLVGGGRIGFYLASQLLSRGMAVTIVESDRTRCEELSDQLPQATIIHGDGTNQQLLLEEGLAHMDAFAALTGIDEENILMGLYAASRSKAKIITKLTAPLSRMSSASWIWAACFIPAILRQSRSSAMCGPCRIPMAPTWRHCIRSSAAAWRRWNSASLTMPACAGYRWRSCSFGKISWWHPLTGRDRF